MDYEKLISLVKERDEIYNRSNPLNRDSESKKNAWADIAHEMGVTAEDCMRRWTNLRDRFNKDYRDGHKTIENIGNRYLWSLFEKMEFIRPHIALRKKRRMQRKAPLSLLRKRLPLPSSEPVQSQISSSESSDSPVSPATSPVKSNEFTQIFDDPLIDPSSLRRRCKIPTNPDVDKSFCEAVETLKKACAQNDARKANPAVYAFGEMITSTICKMNNRNQIKVMQQVTDIVMRIKLEEDELMDQITYSTI